MEPINFEGFVGREIFRSCQAEGRVAQGTLTCSPWGIEFASKKYQLVLPWREISKIKVDASPEFRRRRLASFVVSASSAIEFTGLKVSEAEYRILDEISEAFADTELVASAGASGGEEIFVPLQYADVVDGTGWAPPVGSKVSVSIEASAITLTDFESKCYALPLTALVDVTIEGHTSKTSMGMFGGGFGLKGAAEGMAVAVLVNRLTRKVKSWVIVSIESNIGKVTLLILESNAMQVRNLFRPAQDRALELLNSTNNREQDDLVSGLERITVLYEKGLLSDEEFAKMKTKLLQ